MNFSGVAAMLPIMAKLSAILKMFEHLGFTAFTRKKVKGDTLREKCPNTDQKKLRI